MERWDTVVQAPIPVRRAERCPNRVPRELLCRDSPRNSRFCRSVTFGKLGIAECTPVNEEAFDFSGTLCQRFTKHHRAALERRALTGISAALPRDVSCYDLLCRR